MHSQGTYTCKAPTHEVVNAMKDLSAGAFKLLMYYYCRSTGWEFSDEEIASTLDITPKRLLELKKELIDNGYLLIEKGTNIDNYFIGRKAVRDWKNPVPAEIDKE